MKKIFLFIFLMVVFAFKVNAEACDAYDIKRLKEIANGVEITYELREPYFDEIGVMVYDSYNIKIVGITDELVVYHTLNGENIIFSESILFGGINSLKIKSKECGNILKKITLELPSYNSFHLVDDCKKENNKELNVCQEWVKNKFSSDEFYSAINNEGTDKNKNSIINFKNVIIVSLIVIIALIAVIFYKKRGELK